MLLYIKLKKDINTKMKFYIGFHSFLFSGWFARCLIQECPKTRILIESGGYSRFELKLPYKQARVNQIQIVSAIIFLTDSLG